MNDFNTFVTVPCLLWAALFILVWALDKLWNWCKLKRTNNGTPTNGVHSKEEDTHE